MECNENEFCQSNRLLSDAKQDLTDILPVTQKLYFGSERDYLEEKEKIKLIEFDDEFVERLENGESVFFKGTGDEKLVFCTENETYEVNECEISNSVFLCPGLLYSDDIKKLNIQNRIIKKHTVYGVYQKYLELKPTFPRLSKLRKFLAPTAYSGSDSEVDAEIKGYYLTELLENIQCSKEELLFGLKEIAACSFEGRWRLLSLRYESTVLSLIAGVIEEQNSNLIVKSETKKILESQVPDFIIDHMFSHFAVGCEDDNDAYILKEDKVSQCFAEALLTAAGGTFLLDEFMKTWKASLPPGMEANLNNLRGIALTEKGKSDEDVICLFQEYILPEDIQERFRLLFKRKKKWSLDEITPYIEKISTKEMNVNAMLTKYARPCTLNGKKVFGAKHAN